MIIYVDGSDGSGKTTLIQQLSDRYTSIKLSKGDESLPLWKRVILAASQTNILTDRTPLTEYVYRTYESKVSKFSYPQVLKLLSSGKFIYCKTDTAHEDAMRRGEDNIVTREAADKIQTLYDVFVSSLQAEGIPVLKYNWKTDKLEDVIKFIEGGNEDDVR